MIDEIRVVAAFLVGVWAVLTFQTLLHFFWKGRLNNKIELNTFDVLVARAYHLIMTILFLWALFAIVGPGGWVWRDFQNYASESVCVPKMAASRIILGGGDTYQTNETDGEGITHSVCHIVLCNETSNYLVNLTKINDSGAIAWNAFYNHTPPYQPE